MPRTTCMYFETYCFSRVDFPALSWTLLYWFFFGGSCTCNGGTGMQCVGDKIADDVLWHVMRRLYQGVLYFRMSYSFTVRM